MLVVVLALIVFLKHQKFTHDVEQKWGTAGCGIESDDFGRWSVGVNRGGAAWVVAEDGGFEFKVSSEGPL